MRYFRAIKPFPYLVLAIPTARFAWATAGVFRAAVFAMSAFASIPAASASAASDTLASVAVSASAYQPELLATAVVERLNAHRAGTGLDALARSATLDSAAARYLRELLDQQKNKKKNAKGDTPDLREILRGCGGSGIGTALANRKPVRSGRDTNTYAQLADEMTLAMLVRAADERAIAAAGNTLIGVASAVAPGGRQVQLAAVVAPYTAENPGRAHLAQMPELTANAKKSKLKPYCERECKRVDRIADLASLREGLAQEQGEIIFRYPNANRIKPLLQGKNSGLALDIIHAEQYYASSAHNIVDYGAATRGTLANLTPGKKLLKQNAKQGRGRQFSASLGKAPAVAADDQVQLLVVQNNHVCASIPLPYAEQGSGAYSREPALLADTVTINNAFDYRPKADSTLLSFRIPFDKRKFTYRAEDIEPFLRFLNEPDFVIYELKITAYSSIEGSGPENRMLQERRARSIVEALEARQQAGIVSEVVTQPCWEQFKRDIMSTRHNIMASMTVDDARDYINQYKLARELEPILRNHRYAQIDIRVTYDIEGEKEQAYVANQFSKALKTRDLPLALSIQKYILKATLNGRYPCSVFRSVEIPREKAFAGLLMNNLYLATLADGLPADKLRDEIAALRQLNPDNDYIRFNDILLQITGEGIRDERSVEAVQERVQGLYYRTFTKETVDALNMRLQFGVLRMCDSTPNSDRLRQKAISRIKEIVDIRDETPGNALRLAQIFIDEGDKAFAAELLTPFVEQDDASADMLFTWLSLGSSFPQMTQTRRFARVLARAHAADAERTRTLFDGNHLPLITLENPEVKAFVFRHCRPQPHIANGGQ